MIGSIATTSAKFAILGVDTSTPTASVSSQNANGYAMYLDPANGALQTLRNQTLTLGGSTTGDISLAENTGITGTLTSSGLITGTSGVSIAAGQSYTGAGAVTLSSANSTALTINSGTTGAIDIGSDASAETIGIGTGGAIKTINIGTGLRETY